MSELRELIDGSLFPRVVSHDQARDAALNFINAHFGNEGKGVLTGVPARENHDDLVLVDYIKQRRIAEENAAAELDGLRAEVERLRHDVARQMAIANAEVNRD